MNTFLLLWAWVGVHGSLSIAGCGLRNGLYFKSDDTRIKVLCASNTTGHPTLRVWRQENGEALSVLSTRFRREGGKNLLEEFKIDWRSKNWGAASFIVVDPSTIRERGNHVWMHVSVKSSRVLDFAPYRAAISRALASRPLATCGIHAGAVMLRCVSSHHTSLLILQEHSLSLVPNVASCLAPRIVTVCLDQSSFMACSILDSVQHCVLLDAKVRHRFPHIQLQSAGYNFICWVKVLLQQEALRIASTIVMLDIDVIIFRNFWLLPRIRDWASSQANSNITGKDVLFQLDMMNPAQWALHSSSDAVRDPVDAVRDREALRLDPPGFDQACIVNRFLFNSGQLFLHNSTEVTALFASMHAHKEAILAGKTLEQEFMADLMYRSNLSVCSLPHRDFVGWDHVCGSGSSRNLSFLSIATFHAAGVREEDKNLVLTLGVAEMKKSLKSGLRVRHLGVLCAYPTS